MAAGDMACPQRFCSFEPSIWKDFFIQYEPEPLAISEECMMDKAKILKEDVRMLFQTFNGTLVEKMNLLDTLQRLGIDHLFEDQINTAITEIHETEFNSCSLYEVALHFRLLREHGLWVSPDVFNKFKGRDGKINLDINNEERGLLYLNNAAYLSIPGESVLDEAITFARCHLESIKDSLSYPFSEQVKRNLEIPSPRTLKRLDAPYYIAEYQLEKTYIPSVLELAKLDFNLLQRLHQQELKVFCRYVLGRALYHEGLTHILWGEYLYEEVGLTYSRHRIVECYFWSYTAYYEQRYGDARIILAKLFVLSSLLDDTFDMHATLEEGRKLNEAIQRWDESVIPILPEYLRKYFLRLINTFKEIEDALKPDHKYRVSYCRKAFQTLCKHYQQESEWFHSSHIPSFQDHINCSAMSAGIPMLFVGSLVGMGDEATEEAFEWAIGCPDAIMACAELTRFMDDLASFKHGKNKMDVASSIDSYINQYHVTDEVAMAVLDNLVEDAWKTINQTRFDRRTLLALVNQVVNFTKSMTFLFHDKNDHYTFSRGNKDRIQQQFVDRIH